jgi:hypothetical protein
VQVSGVAQLLTCLLNKAHYDPCDVFAGQGDVLIGKNKARSAFRFRIQLAFEVTCVTYGAACLGAVARRLTFSRLTSEVSDVLKVKIYLCSPYFVGQLPSTGLSTAVVTEILVVFFIASMQTGHAVA